MTRPPKAIRRRWTFRIAAVAIGFAPFVLAELLFAVLGWGTPTQQHDPFVGFASVRPLFELDRKGSTYAIAEDRTAFFRPDSFAATKPKREFRVFCLGGSTVQGRPFGIETAFTTWLELGLKEADSNRTWQVVNCGGISYASYRLVPILEEVLRYEPDLIILYTGHNEFLESRTYEHIKAVPSGVRNLFSVAGRLRTPHVVRSLLASKDKPSETPSLPEEVDAMLDYSGALDKYNHDPAWHRNVTDHFRFNIGRMIRICGEADVPVWLVNPVCDLTETPPFKSQHRPGLSDQDRQRWQRLRDKARDLFRTNRTEAISQLNEAITIDDQHAGLHYDLAKCYETQRNYAAAKSAYVAAKDTDVCPLRITEPLRKAILDTAKKTNTRIVDVHHLFERHRDSGITGGHLLADHVHPSIQGHQMIAKLMLETFQQQGLATLAEGWQEACHTAFAAHLQTLDDDYYLKGEQARTNLMLWASGRAKKHAIVDESR